MVQLVTSYLHTINIILLFFSEMYEAKRWHDDPRFFAPMITIMGETQVFVGDIIHIQDHEYRECYAKVIKFMKVNYF